MILDALALFSESQEITNASAAGTDHIDTLAAGQSVAPGSRLRVAVPIAFVSGDGATLQVSLQSDDNANFSSPQTHFITDAALAAALTQGTVLIDIQMPIGLQRYIRVYYTLAVGTFSAGALDAGVVLDTNRTMDRSL
jgi:hypothetical protein